MYTWCMIKMEMNGQLNRSAK